MNITKSKARVVLLHGTLRSSMQMRRLAKHLQKQGFKTINISYPSRHFDLKRLCDHTQKKIEAQTGMDSQYTIHFVGYSMGGLLVRTLLHHHRPKQLGRVVLIGTPNHGSEFADFLKNNILFRFIFGPSGQQLITDQHQFSHLFGNVDYALGIIAGHSTLDPFAKFLIPGPSDGKVSIQSTKLDGMKDHIVLKGNHIYLPYIKKNHHQTAHFLAHGCFDKTLNKHLRYSLGLIKSSALI